MRNKAQVLLNDEMVPYLIEQFDKGCIPYTSESIVLENGELVNRITFDGCDPFVGNYIFHAGALFYKQTLKNLM
jgi:hypothetical protein